MCVDVQLCVAKKAVVPGSVADDFYLCVPLIVACSQVTSVNLILPAIAHNCLFSQPPAKFWLIPATEPAYVVHPPFSFFISPPLPPPRGKFARFAHWLQADAAEHYHGT